MLPASLRVPDPIDSTKFPALPCVASPVAILTAPDAPELAVPDLNTSRPLTPDVPAFTDCKITRPLLEGEPIPVDKDTAPPVPAFVAVLSPAENIISPPVYVVPAPMDMRISPDLPLVAAPVTMETSPDVPELVVPVENKK